ncbi:hypothetical protein [Maledivibacter halophilus]|uniref:Uncharacterized protein n=1 Tax=Maledivibacter halophilus TaxID=36842 RepID=A0A1T5L7V0_9FIRM|nr:hypothetical protein [Maledivibacter halophilus]SKC72020.1 hypothetical protein SAMN02194393_02550 [Maledivibacter halophilus]
MLTGFYIFNYDWYVIIEDYTGIDFDALTEANPSSYFKFLCWIKFIKCKIGERIGSN